MDPRTAETHELPDVGATLAVAFARDPVLSFLFADPGTRPGLLATFFSARLAGGIGIDETLTVDGLASAAVWVPPLGPDDPGPDFDAAVAAVVAILGEKEAMAKLAALAPLLEAHPHTPHWYLAFVGTRPEGRGRGLASRLIAVVTDRCDAEGIPAYLESSDPANVPLYERHGFAVTGEVEIEGGPTIPLMWREPRG
ncbi:MAG: GNAT family N-acetyltransferase [Acidimicrobiales bacterium]|jgi:ribosomal protein S18 acetylase RimI-like enzyme|nr:GNAT family N-acetyltransferase [Acidimicrobiales bacterium]